MPDRIPVQLAFQGGGAKLGCLLAAAGAIYESTEPLGFKVTRIAGTSAGAIVGAMLATGQDPELFRVRLREIGSKHINAIMPKKSGIRSAWNILNGNPLYDAVNYKKFLQELFTVKGIKYEHMSQLSSVADISIYSVDIRTRKPKIYTIKSDSLIVDALFDSSALPFIFRSFKDKSGLLDGGLINNFPSHALDKVDEYGEVIGFSFPRDETDLQVDTLGRFSGALISTMMDNSVDQALSKINPKNIYCIETKTTSLDFPSALANDLNSDFDTQVKKISSFLGGAIRRMRLERLGVSASDSVRRINDFYEAIDSKQNIEVPSVTVTYRCNGLMERDPHKRDELQVSCEIIAKTKAARVFSLEIGVSSNSVDEKISDLDITVMDRNDKLIGTTVIPVRVEMSQSSVPAVKMIIFFHEDLIVGDAYKLSFSAPSTEVLYDLLNEQRADAVSFSLRVVERVGKLHIIAFIPNELEVVLTDWTERLGEVNWISGGEMTKAEIAKIASPLSGFRAIGWKAADLARGNSAGFYARRR